MHLCNFPELSPKIGKSDMWPVRVQLPTPHAPTSLSLSWPSTLGQIRPSDYHQGQRRPGDALAVGVRESGSVRRSGPAQCAWPSGSFTAAKTPALATRNPLHQPVTGSESIRHAPERSCRLRADVNGRERTVKISK